MNKIVLVSDGRNLSGNTLDFLYSLYQKEPFLLVGSFYQSVSTRVVIPNAYAYESDFYNGVSDDVHEALSDSIKAFKNFCLKHNLEHRIHQQDGNWNIGDVTKESRFADLVVVNGEQFFKHEETNQPNSYLKSLLRHAECAVLVVPESIHRLERIGIAYDGNRDSMFAVKKLCALMPFFKGLPVDIHYWVEKTDDEIPELDYIQEFASRHFTGVKFCEHFFDARKYLGSWTIAYKNTLFVCGSYHRSKISTWIKKSFAEDIIRNHFAPVFIAHS